MRLFTIAKELVKTGMAGLTAIIILSGFTLFFCNSGIHISNESGATDYKWKPHQLKSTMTEGFSWLCMDENGFNNVYISDETISYLLMGSSHMEAINVDAHKNVGYLLNRNLLGRTYNIGTSGHNIYNCVRNMSDAVKEYSPTNYVLLETDRIKLDVESMKQVLEDTYPRIPSYDSGILYTVQKYLPAIKHLYKQIDVWRGASYGDGGNLDDELDNSLEYAVTEVSDEYKELVNSFLFLASESTGNARLIIFYHPRTVLDSFGEMIDGKDQEFLSTFSSTCELNGIIFVDLTKVFKDAYEKKHILPYGFINTAVGSGHLNEAGHELIAEELTAVINGERK